MIRYLPFEHQIIWMFIYGTVYLAAVIECDCESCQVTVFLVVGNVASHIAVCLWGPFVSFVLPINLWVACKGVHVCVLEHLTNALENLELICFPLSKRSDLRDGNLKAQCFKILKQYLQSGCVSKLPPELLPETDCDHNDTLRALPALELRPLNVSIERLHWFIFRE